MVRLGKEFGSVNGQLHANWKRLQRLHVKNRDLRERRQQKEKDAQEDLSDLAYIAASQDQVAQFETRLDGYDSAIITALMENQKRLDAVDVELTKMRDHAYVMDDGRRVFKTEDGRQVFDKTGVEVHADELDFDLIPPDNLVWETYQPVFNEQIEIRSERSDILEFQEQVDAARERVVDDGISEADLEALDADLLSAMPPSVRRHVPGMEDLAVANSSPITPEQTPNIGISATIISPIQ